MSLPQSTNTENSSLTRDVLFAIRYYLGGRRGLSVLAVIVIVAGLALNWSWLVAVGLAPILLSTLPCLVMCAFGVCMMGRSDKEKAMSREARNQGALLLSSDVDAPRSAGVCCSGSSRDAPVGDQESSMRHGSTQPAQQPGQPSV